MPDFDFPDSPVYSRNHFREVAENYLNGLPTIEAFAGMAHSTAYRFLRRNGLIRKLPKGEAQARTWQRQRERKARRAASIARRHPEAPVRAVARYMDVSRRQAMRYLKVARDLNLT